MRSVGPGRLETPCRGRLAGSPHRCRRTQRAHQGPGRGEASGRADCDLPGTPRLTPPVTRNWSELSGIKALTHSGRSTAPGCIYPMATSAGRDGRRRSIQATFQVQVGHLSDMFGEDRFFGSGDAWMGYSAFHRQHRASGGRNVSRRGVPARGFLSERPAAHRRMTCRKPDACDRKAAYQFPAM